MKDITIYTDGACSGNPGKGGWCAILIYNGHEKVLSGYNKETTNNRMELFAVIQGLRQLNQSCNVDIFSDSAYVVNAIQNKWLENWNINGWKTSNKEAVKNDDLWRLLLVELKKHNVEFNKVKGHSNDIYNEKCDKFAKNEITQNS
ncbi:MAG: ribonuclease HI [Clostridia bacterium]